jgi:hypothetical protein
VTTWTGLTVYVKLLIDVRSRKYKFKLTSSGCCAWYWTTDKSILCQYFLGCICLVSIVHFISRYVHYGNVWYNTTWWIEACWCDSYVSNFDDALYGLEPYFLILYASANTSFMTHSSLLRCSIIFWFNCRNQRNI